MRELKFRIWDGQEIILDSNIREYDAYYLLELDGTLVPHLRLGDEYWTRDSAELNKLEYQVMQFTGLYDKNGTQIFEGDILEIEWEWGTERHVVEYKGEWDYPAFELNPPSSDEINGLSEMKATSTNYRVIGNIYEHRTLLEQLEVV